MVLAQVLVSFHIHGYVVVLGRELNEQGDEMEATKLFVVDIPIGYFLMVRGDVGHCGMASTTFHMRAHWYVIPTEGFSHTASYDGRI